MLAIRWERFSWLALAAIVLAYAVFGLSLANAPLQDMPNHLTRAHIIGEMLFKGPAAYANQYHFNPSLNPYLSGDLVLAVVDHWLGSMWAARIWISASIVALPFATYFVLRKHGGGRPSAAAGALLSLYIATNWFFVMGFISFQLALACALWAYGWFLQVKSSSRSRDYAIYAWWVVCGYLLHLSSLIFLCALVGISVGIPVLKREFGLLRAAVLAAPPFLLLLIHFGAGGHSAPGSWPTSWGTWHTKLLHLASPFVRFAQMPEAVLFVAYLAVVALPTLTGVARSLRSQAMPWILAALMLALYCVLPSFTGNVYSIDVRALSYAMLFVVIAGVGAAGRSPTMMIGQLMAACIIAVVNLAYLVYEVVPQNIALGEYRQVADAVPAGAHVLPVNAQPAIGRYRPFAHAGAFATLDVGAITPYLFAADLNPPMTYFSYERRDDAPGEFWYWPGQNSNAPGPHDTVPDWDQVRQEFAFILVTVPWDPGRFQLKYSIDRSNNAAALLRIEKAVP